MKSTLLITLAFIFINNVKAQDIAYQPIVYQTERDSGNLIAKKQDEGIKNRKNTIYGSGGAGFSDGVGYLEFITGKVSYQRKILDFLSLKSSIGVVLSYGIGITYDIGPIVSLGYKRLRFVSGALLYGYVGGDSPVYFAIPLGIEFYGKKGLYISPQSIFLLGKYEVLPEFQLGIGASF